MARRKYRPPPVDPVRRAAPALGAGSGGRRLLRSLSAQDDHRVNAWKRGSELRELFHRPESLQLGRFIWLGARSEEHTSELQSQSNLVCRLLLEKKKKQDVHERGGLGA